MMNTDSETIREKILHLADQLPADATWEDVMYQLAMHRSIEQGLMESEAGRLVPHEDILKEFGITE